MKSLWSDADAADFSGPLGPRVYTSRLLGRDKSLVLHGGGNTSVKVRENDLFGERTEVLYVKGSGWDLETIEAAGFAPVDLAHLRRLATLTSLSDPQMVNELATHTLRASAPAPSVESILHALLPHKYVDHTHADAVLSVSNSPDGEKRVRDIYGDRVVVIPYRMPGFDLAAYCAREFPKQKTNDTVGMVLLSHGILSFANEARESYERMIELVSMAENYLAARKAWSVGLPPAAAGAFKREEAAKLRSDVSKAAGFPMLCRCNDAAHFLGFARHADVARISQSGPATPDHVIRTKPLPMLGRDVADFSLKYRHYFETNSKRAKEPKTMLDPAPRVALDPELGLAAFGRTARDVGIAEDIYEHTIGVILRAESLGGWKALDDRHTFDVEYWDLEQAKLKKAGSPPVFAGEVVVVTGAASGIGKACMEAFLERGAAVVGLDRNPAVESLWKRADFLGLICDLADEKEINSAIDKAVKHFGGVDMLVLDAIAVNIEENQRVMQACHALLKLAPRGGRIVAIGSKNMPAPGPGVRLNTVQPSAVNVVGSKDVAELAAEMCGPLFARTTAARVPVDASSASD